MQAIGPNQERWLQALESGTYQQGMGWLLKDGKHCCLGVACELFCESKTLVRDHYQFNGKCATAPESVVDAIALRDDLGNFVTADGDGDALVSMNERPVSFAGIAAFCRANPEAVFTDPR